MGLFFDPKSDRTQAWSNGGGTQSTAIAALIVRGRLPKPDLAVMVNTERENSNTLPYFETYVSPSLTDIGVEVHIVQKSDFARVDLTSKNGKHLLIPAFTDQSGRLGKLQNFCSGEWKRDVISRWLRSKGVEQCDQWMGFSLDEMRRVKSDRRQWLRAIYPLIDLRMTRAACVRVVQEMGWPEPPRSSCWMCPNKSGEEWSARVHVRRSFPAHIAAGSRKATSEAGRPNFIARSSAFGLRNRSGNRTFYREGARPRRRSPAGRTDVGRNAGRADQPLTPTAPRGAGETK